MSHDRILILDFGAQYSQLIARRVREQHVYCELHPHDVTDGFIREFAPRGIILSGGPASVYEDTAPRAPRTVWKLGVPVLGICYGMQDMAEQLGGKVESSKVREFGYAEVRARGHSKLLEGIQDRVNGERHGLLDVWMSHGDKVIELPPGFKLMATSDACAIAGMADESRRLYGVQFHPEVTHTKQGGAILKRFVLDICGARADWNMPDYVGEAVERIRAQVGKEEVVLGLSGGVDSSVAAALIHRAIGDRLTCIFVDTGLLRLNEAEQVMATFARHLGVKVDMVDAAERFMRALAGIADPEEKRKIIGREFVHVFQEEAAKLPQAKWLAQGTIYPDVIESAGHEEQEGAHDQVAPQRRRPAGNAASQAARAAARPVQGRSAGARPGARPAARDGVPAPVPGAGPGRAHPRRGEARVCRSAAPGRRHLHRRVARGGLVRKDGAGVRGVPAGAVGRA